MSKYNKYRLTETAQDYLMGRLKVGNKFAHYLLRDINFASGELFTFLPASADQNRFDRFREGGLADSMQSISHLGSHIRRFLQSHDCGVVLFEDALANKGDKFVAELGTRMLFYGKEIYHYLLPENSHPEVVTWTITQASSPHLFICAMTTLGAGQTFTGMQTEVSDATLERLAKTSEELVVGAYDGEGFVYWKKM